MKKVKLKQVLKQYRNTHRIEDDTEYSQVTISQTGNVYVRGKKHGSKIGRKRQFKINLREHPNTLIFIRQGVMKGGIGICPPEVDDCVVTENMPMFEIVGVEPDYLINYIHSPMFKKDVGKLVPLGTAQKAIHERQLLEIEIPIPPIDSQKQILKKIKSIENEIQQLEQNISKDETLLKKLRQAILSEAVSGKLVPQNKEDEPASELLKKIKREKEKLIKEGKIKKGKELPEISEDEIPYDLPKNWCWVRLGDVLDFNYGKGNKDNSGEIPVYGANGILRYCEKPLVKEKCIIVGRKGSAGALNIIEEPCWPSDVAYYIIPPKNTDFKFIYYLLKTLNLESIGKGIKPGLNRNDAYILPIGLPPLPEQLRIVEKVDALMRFCDELEDKIKENSKNSKILMNSVLKEVFENGSD